MPDRRVLTEQLVHAFRASLTDANLASGYDSANMQIARVFAAFKEPAPQTREARWGCYCGAVNTDRTCYVCGRVGAN